MELASLTSLLVRPDRQFFCALLSDAATEGEKLLAAVLEMPEDVRAHREAGARHDRAAEPVVGPVYLAHRIRVSIPRESVIVGEHEIPGLDVRRRVLHRSND